MTVKIIECPRDAWQGLAKIIPIDAKVAYLSMLLEAGFRHLDAVSFVAPRYVPQMADSEQVMAGLTEPLKTSGGDPPPEIIGIIVNERGLERALWTPGVTTLGYPYSISERFRRSNANMSEAESRALVEKLKDAAAGAGRELVVYLSMAFGNPYQEPWSAEIVVEAVRWLADLGVRTVSLADTTGVATPNRVGDLFRSVLKSAPGIELGVHLHSRPENGVEKVLAAFEAGCRRFDSALTGLGGCPFAEDDLVGNIATETVVSALAERRVPRDLDPAVLPAVVAATRRLRGRYAIAAPESPR